MSKKPLVWSPYPKAHYTVKNESGERVGFGAQPVFNRRPGLWNMFWLHSATLDEILELSADADEIPVENASLKFTELSADFMCGDTTLEELAESVTPDVWVNRVESEGLHPPIREFWDELEGDSWWGFVSDRLQESRYVLSETGNVFKANF